MPPGSGFVEHVIELIAPLGAVNVRRMFGGYGIYCDGVFIAIIAADTLFLKTDEENRGAFEHAGCERFSYLRRGRRAELNFHRAPEQALDAPHLMMPWARSALGAALRARAARPQTKTGRKSRPVSGGRRRS